MFDLIMQYIFNGIVLGSSYALIAIGLTMIFGIMNIANFAHGQLYMIGGFFAFYFTRSIGLNYFVAMIASVLATMVLGILFERMIFRRLRNRPIMSSVLATIGLSILLENLALVLWGPRPESIPSPFSLNPVQLGPIFTTGPRLFAVGITLLSAISRNAATMLRFLHSTKR